MLKLKSKIFISYIPGANGTLKITLSGTGNSLYGYQTQIFPTSRQTNMTFKWIIFYTYTTAKKKLWLFVTDVRDTVNNDREYKYLNS
jgi:hypothetical protein